MGQKFIVDTMVPLFYKSDSENIYDMNLRLYGYGFES